MTPDTKKKSFLDPFVISDRASCAKAIRNGGIAAMLSAAITTIFAVAGFFVSSRDKTVQYLLDPWILADVVLIVVLGVFVFRKSRVASTILVGYWALAKALMWYQLGAPSGLVMSVIFFAIFVTAMRGTYLWNSKYRNEV